MTRVKNTLILLALAVALSAWWALVERPKMLQKVYPGRIFPNLIRSDITRIVIEKRTGGKKLSERIVLVRRQGKNWFLEEPIKYPVARGPIDTMLGAIVFLEAKVLLRRAEGAFPKAGPRLILHFTAQGEAQTVLIGNRHPAEALNYYRVGEKLFLADESLKLYCDRSVFDWRDKSVLPLSPHYVKWFRIEHKGREVVEIQRGSGDVWFLRKPKTARAAASKVNDLLDGVNSLQALEFYNDDGKADLKRFKLDPPAWRVVVVSLQNDERYEILLSERIADTDPPQIYAKRADRPQVLRCEDRATQLLSMPVEELRDMRALPFTDYGWVKRVAVRGGGRDFSLVRTKKNGPWMGIDRESGVKQFSSTRERAQRLLDEISNLRVTAFRPGESIGEETFRITVETQGAKQPLELIFGRKVKENVYLARRKGVEGESDEPFEIYTTLPERIRELGPLLYRDPALVGSIPDNKFLHFWLITWEGRWLLLRFDTWRVDGCENVDLDQDLVAKAAALIQEPKAAFYEPNPGSLASIGLDRVHCRLRVKFDPSFGRLPYYELFIGKKVDPPGPMSYAKLDSDPTVFIMDPTPLFDLAAHLKKICPQGEGSGK